MDTMVLLVAVSRRYEDEDCTCSHTLAGVPKQVRIEGFCLHIGDNALKTVPVNFQSHLIAYMDSESVGGSI